MALSTAAGCGLPAKAQDPSTAAVGDQEDEAPVDPAARSDRRGSGDADDILITGSVLSRGSAGLSSPLTVVTQSELSRSGVTTISDALRSLSADGAGSISIGFQGGFAAGASGISLRGLGVSSTLVLIDGQRTANFPLEDDGLNAFVDLGSIPFTAVDRVEILRDSASATYGSGAIGGVVNIITKKSATGISGGGEVGTTHRGDGANRRFNLNAGFGDLDRRGFTLFVGGEYAKEAAISGRDRGFPFDTADLSLLGGQDFNYEDRFQIANTNAVVARTTQRDLDDPFSGGTALVPSGVQRNGLPYYNFTTLNTDCEQGTFSATTGANRGTGCIHDLEHEYSQIQPKQQRFALFSRLATRLADDVELNVMATYARSDAAFTAPPAAIRQNQPAGLAPALSSSTPGGVVLPVYICTAGKDCISAPDRRLNPNNPYAAAFANDPQNGAARIYYRFGDIPSAYNSRNEVIRGTAALNGRLSGSGSWTVSGALARDRLSRNYDGVLNIDGLKTAINTGAYNFVDPGRNSATTRALVAPSYRTHAKSSLASLDARINYTVAQLPGGPLSISAGGQARREELQNPGSNPDLDRFQNINIASGRHTIIAGFAEAGIRLLKELQLNLSSRYDHYSEGFGRFSPKAGVRFQPAKQISFRGSWSKNFSAPSFSTIGSDSSYGSFLIVTPPLAFQQAHGGALTGGNTNIYTRQYSLGVNFIRSPVLPESAKSLSAGIVVNPVEWLTLDVNYFRITKSGSITRDIGLAAASDAYYAGKPLRPGYAVALLDAPDPLYPEAMRRLLLINAPYVNSTRLRTSGLDIEVSLKTNLTRGVGLSSRLLATGLFYSNGILPDGTVQKYAGTLGPYQLSSGAGTPRWKGTWQTTMSIGAVSATAIAHYVSHIKNVAADSGPLTCSDDENDGNLYGTGTAFCHIRSFAYADLALEYAVTPAATLTLFVGNITDAGAPLAPASYAGVNYIPTWHMAGVIGRTFRAGLKFHL